jgi:hypothetical protein
MADAAGDGANGEAEMTEGSARERAGEPGKAGAAPAGDLPRRRDWLELATLGVLTATLLAAGYAAYEGSVLSSATNDLVKTQATNAHREVRAYVGVMPGDVENFGDRQAQKFTLIRKNYGTSPAYNVFVRPTLAAVLKPSDPIPTAENLPPSGAGRLTLFPGMSVSFTVAGSGNATSEQVENVRQGKDAVFVYAGIVTYLDSYGEEHYTRYCWLFRGSSMSERDAEWCPGHNDAD